MKSEKMSYGLIDLREDLKKAITKRDIEKIWEKVQRNMKSWAWKEAKGSKNHLKLLNTIDKAKNLRASIMRLRTLPQDRPFTAREANERLGITYKAAYQWLNRNTKTGLIAKPKRSLHQLTQHAKQLIKNMKAWRAERFLRQGQTTSLGDFLGNRTR